jgi:UDP-3-O-[3-hydroxymyristoyl] glucosamine N-acyltransferase
VRVTIQQLAALVQGEVRGDGAVLIDAARPLAEAEPGHISFLEGERHLRHLKTCRASAVVAPVALAARLSDPTLLPEPTPAFLLVADALSAFVTVVQSLQGAAPAPPTGIDPLASVHPSAVLGPEVSIAPFAVVGAGCVLGARCRLDSGVVLGRNCRLGDDVTLHPNVVLYDGTVLGHRVLIHANAVLGADGFGFRFHQGRHHKVPQLGSVEVGDDVEIGACSTIDRGTFQATRIGEGSKIDNLVMIGHNCRIGPHNVLAGQVGIAGSSTTGSHVVMAGQVGIADHVHIGDGARLGGRSGVAQDIPPGERMLGAPARTEREAKRILLSLDRLPGVVRDVRRILRHLGLEEDGRGAA